MVHVIVKALVNFSLVSCAEPRLRLDVFAKDAVIDQNQLFCGRPLSIHVCIASLCAAPLLPKAKSCALQVSVF